jgi:hypothetical protein
MSKTKLFVYVLAVAALVFFVGRTVPFGTKTLEVRFEETNLSVTFERPKYLIPRELARAWRNWPWNPFGFIEDPPMNYGGKASRIVQHPSGTEMRVGASYVRIGYFGGRNTERIFVVVTDTQTYEFDLEPEVDWMNGFGNNPSPAILGYDQSTGELLFLTTGLRVLRVTLDDGTPTFTTARFQNGDDLDNLDDLKAYFAENVDLYLDPYLKEHIVALKYKPFLEILALLEGAQ